MAGAVQLAVTQTIFAVTGAEAHILPLISIAVSIAISIAAHLGEQLAAQLFASHIGGEQLSAMVVGTTTAPAA